MLTNAALVILQVFSIDFSGSSNARKIQSFVEAYFWSLISQEAHKKSDFCRSWRQTRWKEEFCFACLCHFSNYHQSLSLHIFFLTKIIFHNMGRPTNCEFAPSTGTKSTFRWPTHRRKVPRRSTCSSRRFISTSTNSAALQDHPSWRRRSVRRLIDGFTTLRSLLPKRCDGETPTKVQTLQMATKYIKDLSSWLKESEEKRDDFDRLVSDFSETSSQSCLSLL